MFSEVPRALRKNINTHDVLLRHFRNGIYHEGIGGCALLYLMYS